MGVGLPIAMSDSVPVNPDETGGSSEEKPKATLADLRDLTRVTPTHIIPCKDCGESVEVKAVSCGNCSGPLVSDSERAALKAVLVRETTAKISHGGLRGLLGLAHHEAEALLSFLKKI